MLRTTVIFVVWAVWAIGCYFVPPCLHGAEEEASFSATPYKIRVFLFFHDPGAVSDSQRRELAEGFATRCRVLFGSLWTVSVEFPRSGSADECRLQFAEPPDEWASFDKILVAEFDRTRRRFDIVEFDTRTHQSGMRRDYTIDDPVKTVDLLLRASVDVFRPIAKLERSTGQTAMLRFLGSELYRPGLSSHETDATLPQSVFGAPGPGTVFMPFLRSRDREGRTIAVLPISWTVLIAEEIDPGNRLLRCRIESGLRDALGARFRGRSEIFALAVPTPSVPTILRLQPNRDADHPESEPVRQNLPPYEVFEALRDEPKLHRIGQTAPDGTFVLEPVDDRPVRICVIRNGRTVLARFPIARGWKAEFLIPIPDDRVRLETEAVLLGIQEELIDATARREILKRREKKFQEIGDSKMVGETRNELARLKSNERFLIDLEQARLRFQSDDPVLRRRLEKMFRETEDAIKKRR